MIPGKVKADACGQTINLRLPYGLLVSIGIEATGGAECDDQKRNNGHHTVVSCGTTTGHHIDAVQQKQAIFLAGVSHPPEYDVLTGKTAQP